MKSSNYLSHSQVQELNQKSDLKAITEIGKVWLVIGICFTMVGLFPNPITILLAILVIGGRQLACAIIMHDAAHYSLFKTRKYNDWFGNWLGAYPILQDVTKYRPYHFQHHRHTGHEEDPDLNLVTSYPASQSSMARKITRDLLGITGIKGILGLIAMYSGYLNYELGGRTSINPNRPQRHYLYYFNAIKGLSRPVLFNLCLWGLLLFLGHPLLYLLWPISLITSYPFCIRIRAIAEHSMVENQEDPMKNTRTTYANFIERLLFAPLNVNYHAEHHLNMGIPSYNLPRMHKMLLQTTFFDSAPLENGYLSILKKAID